MQNRYLVMTVFPLLLISVSQTSNAQTAVDMGGGVYWAPFNLGAASKEEFGTYYRWGEVKKGSGDGKESYLGSIFDKVLPKSRDAASVELGGGWRIPTRAEFKELIDNCSWKYKIINGIPGYLAVSKNGNTLFFPAAGEAYGEEDRYLNRFETGLYQTSERGQSECYYIKLSSIGKMVESDKGKRFISIRAVTTIPGEKFKIDYSHPENRERITLIEIPNIK